MSENILVEYVGKKASETDHLYGTGITWIGSGDVHEVPAGAWERMKVHADVWREAAKVESDSTPQPGLKPAAGDEVQLQPDIAYAMSAQHSEALRREEAEQAAGGDVRDAASDLAQKLAKMDDDKVRAYVKAAGAGALHHKLMGSNLRARAIEAIQALG